MRLLTQLNFSQIPKLESFPEKGLLQFFVADREDDYGIDFNDYTSQTNFRIIYRNSIEKDESILVKDFSFLDAIKSDHFPVSREQKIEFKPNEEAVPLICHYEFQQFFGAKRLEELEGNNLEYDLYQSMISSQGSKIGGYPDFKQGDPRDSDHDILLLQLGYSEKTDVMWGDAGVANFFIKKEDLLNLNFSNVFYAWDCY